jgi:hypothetical protein
VIGGVGSATACTAVGVEGPAGIFLGRNRTVDRRWMGLHCILADRTGDVAERFQRFQFPSPPR